MAERVEFMSPAYVEALRAAFESRAREVCAELGDRSFTFAEVYKDAPPHIAPSGEIAFHMTYANGRGKFVLGAPERADVLLRWDYAAVLPIARIVVAGDPERQAEMQRLSGAARAAGKLTVSGDPSLVPAAMRPVHDEVARIVA